MTRVLRIINRLNLGGPTYNAGYLTRHLAPEFDTILLAGMKDDSEAGSEHILEQIGVTPEYLTSMRRSINPLSDWATYREIRAKIKAFKPDIVHTHASKAGAVGRLAAHHEGVKHIVHTFHGHTFHSYFSKPVSRAFLSIERYLAKRSSAIIAISELQRKELVHDYKVAHLDKVRVIPLGFDLSRFQENEASNRTSFRAEWGIEQDRIAVGIVGRLVPIKNHELFLDMLAAGIKEEPRLIGVIVGDGELRAHLEQYAKSKHIAESDLIFTSWEQNVARVMHGLDIVALTSKNEGTPVSLIEAQAAGKPVISTSVGGVADVVHKEAAFLGAPDNQSELVAHLLNLAQNETLRTESGRKGIEFVFARFSYERLVNDTRKLYNELIG